ncbi:hypothetical protein HPB50_010722 [Hyalomma asiaticum]|uniref:Uncharacterized protein n=1 Tax=Hyalomma asiaticum TaxID=266040 RepID=A0ACB7S5Z0_HYAAI|nr:hypothetical protein HPB50_010722 [Hyalomma asiaticum]
MLLQRKSLGTHTNLASIDSARHQESPDIKFKVGARFFTTLRSFPSQPRWWESQASHQSGVCRRSYHERCTTAVDAPKTPDFPTGVDVTVAGETISRKEFEESAGWRTVGSRKLLIDQPPVTGAESQQGNNSKKQCERRLRQIERSSRMPQLPRGGLRVAEHGAARLATSIYHAAKIPRGAQDEDTICPNFQQNIIVVSTPTEAHADKYQKIASIKIGNQTFETNAYEAAPDCTTAKGTLFPPSNTDEEAVRGPATDPEQEAARDPHPIPVPVKISEPHAWTCWTAQGELDRRSHAGALGVGGGRVSSKMKKQVTPIPPPPIAVTPTEEMEEGATPPPTKRGAEEQNTFEDLGSDHYIIAIRVHGGPRKQTGRQLKMVDWTRFRKSRENQVQPIDDIERWTHTLKLDVKNATQTVPPEAHLEQIDSRLLRMWEAKQSLKNRRAPLLFEISHNKSVSQTRIATPDRAWHRVHRAKEYWWLLTGTRLEALVKGSGQAF